MSQEIQAVLEELAANRTLNSTYGGAAVVQAAMIVEIRKLRAAVEKANEPVVVNKVSKPRKSKEKADLVAKIEETLAGVGPG